MHRWVSTVFALLLSVVATGAFAQATDWVQIEAHPDLSTSEARASAYAARLPDVVGYQLPSGWYAIALGPYDPVQARAQLARLRASGAIPPDSYIADGADFRQRFWPLPGTQDQQAAPAAPDQAPTQAPALGPAPAQDMTQAAAPDAPAAGAATVTIQPGAGLPDETVAEARSAESLLTEEERKDLQRALAWAGDYRGAIDGDIGPGTRGAMAAWQRENGFDGTGVLTTAQRAKVLGTYRSDQKTLGMQPVNDANAGISIDLPMALVGFAHYQPPFAHYPEKNGSGVQVVLISAPGGQAALAGLYETLQSLSIMPTTGPRDLSASSFDISGTGDALRSTAHAEIAGDAVKGYIVSWQPGHGAFAAAGSAGLMDHALAEMRASFRSTGPAVLDGSMVALTAAQKQGMISGLALRKPVATRSGFFVDAAGDVLTTTAVLQDCGSVTFGDRQKASVAFRDDTLGIALLKPAQTLAPRAYAKLAGTDTAPSAQVAVSGYSYGGALMAAAMTFGSFDAAKGLNGEANLRRLTLKALPGDAGGPVLDASGALVGMLLPHPAGTDKMLPAATNFAAGAGPIASALAAHGVTLEQAAPAPAMAPVDLAALGRRMTVLVSCWK